MPISRLRNVVSAGLLICVGVPVLAADTAPSYTRDIKGILSNRCVRCHGPDPEGRAGGGDEGLRLDTFEGATADLGGHAAIVPGKAYDSELIARIMSTDPDLVMPKDRSANGTSASVGLAGRIMRSNRRSWLGRMRPDRGGAAELSIHAQGRIFVVGADRP